MAFLAIALVAGGASAAWAQGPSAEERTAPASLADRVETPETGARVGPFELDGAVTLSAGFDDNLFATRNDKVGDWLGVVGWDLSAEVDGDRLDLTLSGSGEHARYRERSDENYDDVTIGGEAAAQVAPDWRLFGGASYGYLHEPRESPDDVNGAEPTLYHQVQTFGGVSGKVERVTAWAGATYERLDFQDVRADAGGPPIDNDDRDRNLITLGGRIGYDLGAGIEPFVQGLVDLRRYDDAVDDFGFDRDSHGYSVAFGLRYEVSRRLEAEASVGRLLQDYADPQLKTIDTFAANASLRWRPDPRTRIRAGVSRSIEETTIPGAPGYAVTGFSLGLEQAVHPQLFLDADVGYYDNQYYGVVREDHVLSAGLGARYFPVPHLFVGTDYRFRQRDSSDPDEDYDENRVFLTFGAQMAPGYDPDFDYGPVPEILPGLYAGLQGGFGNLGTELEGGRGGTGTLTADFGDHGPEAGIFAGIGGQIGPWYLGLEADAAQSWTEWEHVNAPDARVFSVRRGASFGVGPLAGYRLDGGSLVYGRFGLALAAFETDYRMPDGSDTGRDDWVAGLRFGLGTEVPLTAGAFARLDYTYTAYGDLDVDWQSETGRPGQDNFASDETLLRVGLGWRFGARQEREASDPPADLFQGFFVGLQGGYGALNSREEGPRGQGGRAALVADRGDTGAAGGLFAGYGHTLGPVYLGVEAEFELADETRDNERDPQGRTIATDKWGTAGASLRFGYALRDTALIYGRVGAVVSGIDTQYETGSASFDRSDALAGLRFGGGVEVPASESVFVRMDYSFTDYEGYDLEYGRGNSDAFETAESLLRVGLAYRF